MKLVSWLDREWDIICDDSYPCKYIEDLIAPLEYTRKWAMKTDKALKLDYQPPTSVLSKYQLTYTIKEKDNLDTKELKFIIFLVDKAIDYINNLELVLTSDEEEEQPNDEEDIF